MASLGHNELTWPSLVQEMAWRLFGAKTFPEPVAADLRPFAQNLLKFISNTNFFFEENAFENVVCKMKYILSSSWSDLTH